MDAKKEPLSTQEAIDELDLNNKLKTRQIGLEKEMSTEEALKILNVKSLDIDKISRIMNYRLQSIGRDLGGSIDQQMKTHRAWQKIMRVIAAKNSESVEKMLTVVEKTKLELVSQEELRMMPAPPSLEGATLLVAAKAGKTETVYSSR